MKAKSQHDMINHISDAWMTTQISEASPPNNNGDESDFEFVSQCAVAKGTVNRIQCYNTLFSSKNRQFLSKASTMGFN